MCIRPPIQVTHRAANHSAVRSRQPIRKSGWSMWKAIRMLLLLAVLAAFAYYAYCRMINNNMNPFRIQEIWSVVKKAGFLSCGISISCNVYLGITVFYICLLFFFIPMHSFYTVDAWNANVWSMDDHLPKGPLCFVFFSVNKTQGIRKIHILDHRLRQFKTLYLKTFLGLRAAERITTGTGLITAVSTFSCYESQFTLKVSDSLTLGAELSYMCLAFFFSDNFSDNLGSAHSVGIELSWKDCDNVTYSW